MKESDKREPVKTSIPEFSEKLSKPVRPVYRFFDWLFSSDYNPLYRSGTLAVWFLVILLVTGLYLSFFYSVSQPYESIKNINENVILGKWIRAIHRYATVGALISIIFHVLQLLVQGKNWGPRTLAWLSGIFLTLMFFISAWTGYVMVWDLHGQRIAISGAGLLSVFPFLREIVKAAFDGTNPLPAGFFFMNLFMHVAIPVMIIMFLWVHTAKLSRSVWLPDKNIQLWSACGIAIIALLWPAPLLEKADLTLITGEIKTDIISGFWMSWADKIGPLSTLLLLTIITIIIFFIPWLIRPKKIRLKSTVDEDACSGCMQCVLDCPYEAIKMIPRSDGKRQIARVITDNCVSCGICAAACADFAIGPPGRSAADQRVRAAEFCSRFKVLNGTLDLVLIACTNNHLLQSSLKDYAESEGNTAIYNVECCGCLHVEVIEQILLISKGAVLIGCPARNCFNRDGGDLLTQRIFEKRVPFLDRNIDRQRLLIAAYSEAEIKELLSALRNFKINLLKENKSPSRFNKHVIWARAAISSALLFLTCAWLSQIPSGDSPLHGLIRVAGTLPSSVKTNCHPPTDEEVKNILPHMRPLEICTETHLSYKLEIKSEGNLILSKIIEDSTNRTDRPLYLNAEAQLSSNNQTLEVLLNANDKLMSQCRFTADPSPGRIILVFFDRESESLKCNINPGNIS